MVSRSVVIRCIREVHLSPDCEEERLLVTLHWEAWLEAEVEVGYPIVVFYIVGHGDSAKLNRAVVACENGLVKANIGI